MALIIEDGSLVADANSYVTVDEVRAFATTRGINNLPAAEADVEVLIIKAMDYVEGLGNKFKGIKYAREQSLLWPRSHVYVDGYLIYHDEIPTQLKNAVCQLAIDSNSIDVNPNGDGQEVVREKIGPIETEFAARGSTTVRPVLNKAHNFLKPLIRNVGVSVTRG